MSDARTLDSIDTATVTMDGYQNAARSYAIYPEQRGIEYTVLGLTSEAGEVAGKVKKQIRDGSKWTGEQMEDHRQAVIDELGDVLWYAAELAHQLNITLGEVAARNIWKLAGREKRGTLRGSGDKR